MVDDDEEIVGFVTMGLESAGYEVLSALDGEEGLYLARTSRPDLILLDLAMPRMHGFEVCEAIRSDRDLSGTKIVVTSGKNYAADMKRAKALGADLYVVKPYGCQQILDVVGKVLGNGRA